MATGASSAWQPPVLIPPAVPIVVDEDPKPVEAPKKPEPPKEPEDPKQAPASKNTATPCPAQDDVSSGASSGEVRVFRDVCCQGISIGRQVITVIKGHGTPKGRIGLGVFVALGPAVGEDFSLAAAASRLFLGIFGLPSG